MKASLMTDKYLRPYPGHLYPFIIGFLFFLLMVAEGDTENL